MVSASGSPSRGWEAELEALSAESRTGLQAAEYREAPARIKMGGISQSVLNTWVALPLACQVFPVHGIE